MTRIYCAGPLFNERERAEMAQIASVLEHAGFSTFLPHRDGLEFAKLKPALEELGASPTEADAIVNQAVFSLDTFQLLTQCDAVVANLNGRVPDEGTIVEATLAWHSRKPLVLYKADSRSMLSGQDNPMITGLGGFETIADVSALPEALHRKIKARDRNDPEEVLRLGKNISRVRSETNDISSLASILLRR